MGLPWFDSNPKRKRRHAMANTSERSGWRILAIIVAVVTSLALFGCGASSGSWDTKNEVKSSGGSSTAKVDSRYTGSWGAREMWFGSNFENTADFDPSYGHFYLNVKSDGTAIIDFNMKVDDFSGQLYDTHAYVLPAQDGSGYILYDKNSEAVGVLEYNYKGPVDWLLLITFDPDDNMVAYAFTH